MNPTAVYIGQWFISVAFIVAAFFLGRRYTELVDKIRTLENREPKQEPEKPTITGGAYQPPKDISPVPDAKRRAGVVEAKTPERMEWENNNAIEEQAVRG